MVSMLIEKPVIESMPNVPSSTTGTAMVGMIVARQFCRKKNITHTTSTMASTRVLMTSCRAARTNGVVSNGITASTPWGMRCLRLSTHSMTFACVSRAFAPEASLTAMPEEG